MDASIELVKHLLRSIVHLRVTVPREHPSSRILGDERFGSGVVVDASGLILSVNYVVMGGGCRRSPSAAATPSSEVTRSWRSPQSAPRSGASPAGS